MKDPKIALSSWQPKQKSGPFEILLTYPMPKDCAIHQFLKLLLSSCTIKNGNGVFHVENGNYISQYTNFSMHSEHCVLHWNFSGREQLSFYAIWSSLILLFQKSSLPEKHSVLYKILITIKIYLL